MPQRKFSSINTTLQLQYKSSPCDCCELLAGKWRSFYIWDNWGCCKCSAVQWRCTYSFQKHLYIITHLAPVKCARSFSLFMPCGKMCLEMSACFMIYAPACFWCVSSSVQHGIPAAAPRSRTATCTKTHQPNSSLHTFCCLLRRQISRPPSWFFGSLREIQWCC